MASVGASSISRLNFRWHKGVEGLKQLENDWLKLTAEASLFARYEWNLAAASHLLAESEQIWICQILDREKRTLAFIPVIGGTETVKPFGPLPALALGWSHQLATFDFPMAPETDATQIGKTMLKAFKSLPFKWEVISWPRVMADSNAAKVAHALGQLRTDITSAAPSSTFYTANTPDLEKGLEVFVVKSAKLRSKLAYTMRRLTDQGPIQMRMAREQGDVTGYFEEFLRLESSGWKGAHGTGTAIALVPAAKAFYSCLLNHANPQFETDIALLFCGDKPVAGQFLIRVAHWEHQYKIAYDEAFAKLSPGQILHQMVIEQAKNTDGVDRVSLVTGQTWHKEWAPIPEPTLHIYIFRKSWRTAVIHLGRKAISQVRQTRARLLAVRSRNVPSPEPKQSDPEVKHAA